MNKQKLDCKTLTFKLKFWFFYSLICYAEDFPHACIVATTWQMTILALLFVLAFFGQKLSKKIWFFTTFIFIGITLVNLSYFDIDNFDSLILSFLAVLIAAFPNSLGILGVEITILGLIILTRLK